MSDNEGAPREHHYLRSEPRREVTMRGAQRRASLARVSRILFFVALIALIAPVAYFMLRPEPPAGPEPEPGLAGEAGVQVMTGFNLEGQDADGRPFQVVADTLTRRSADDGNTVELASPCFLDNARPGQEAETTVCSLAGAYDSTTEILQLETDVDLTTDNGYAFRTSSARVHVVERRAEGDDPVEGTGPFGAVRADRWAFEQDGAILHFEGNVRTVFNGGDDDEAAEDAGQ
jgi:lipopolysaccharide export system protein LptC